MPLGLYISVPFCRTKCSYCNFASDVFSKTIFERYIDRVCADIANAGQSARELGAGFDRTVDSVYLGGGTPTILDVAQLERLFVIIRQNFAVCLGAEITVECAPGTLRPELIGNLQRWGVSRVSLGVQSFVDEESRAVGRLHTREKVLQDIASLRAARIENINVDLIAGLPHQTAESWEVSVREVLATGVPHVSVYMLEVDEDSRLGRELIAGGTRYHAHFAPDDDLTADLYVAACERLEAAGIRQHEISNFARPGQESQHNLKYWRRQPYLGFGVDAHSMLGTRHAEQPGSIRFSTPDSLERYMAGEPPVSAPVGPQAALEEAFFLGLRLNAGINLQEIGAEFGPARMDQFSEILRELVSEGLLEKQSQTIRLTPRGRLLSNEAFQRFITVRA